MATNNIQLKNAAGARLYPLASGVHDVKEYVNKLALAAVPRNYTITSSSNIDTWWSMTGNTYSVKSGKYYLTMAYFTVNEGNTAAKGTAQLTPYRSGTASTAVGRTTLASRNQNMASVAEGGGYWLYQLFSPTSDQTAYNKVFVNGAGTSEHTYNVSITLLCVYECETEALARKLLSYAGQMTQEGLVIDNDIIADLQSGISGVESDIMSLQETVSEAITTIQETVSEAIPESEDIIECWGDSQTEGVSGGTAWPRLLADMAGYTYNNSSTNAPAAHSVNNFANGGEKVCDIAVRYGSLPVYLNPVTIPAGTTQQACTVFSDGGDNFDALGIKWAMMNPCYVEGKQIYLRDSSAGGNNKTVGGTASGDTSLEITRPTRIMPYNKAVPRNRIMIIQMGANKGYGGTIESFCHIVDQMLEMIPSNEKRYVIISTFTTTWIDDYAAAEKYLAYKYGRHYVNIREYLINFGLDDNGLEATEQDTADIAAGKVPHSLCVDFNIHMNTYGTTSQAKCVYQRLTELGYLT